MQYKVFVFISGFNKNCANNVLGWSMYNYFVYWTFWVYVGL